MTSGVLKTITDGSFVSLQKRSKAPCRSLFSPQFRKIVFGVAVLLAKTGFDTAENKPSKVRPSSAAKRAAAVLSSRCRSGVAGRHLVACRGVLVGPALEVRPRAAAEDAGHEDLS